MKMQLASLTLPRISHTGEPVGDIAAATKIARPNGVKQWEWAAAIELAVSHFRMTSGVGEITLDVLKALDVDERISMKTWQLIFEYEHNLETFRQALAVRGVLPLGTGLSAEQNMAIEILSDPTQGSLAQKLRKLGVSKNTLDKWLLHTPFQEQLNLLTKQRMNSAKSFVDVQLTANAIDGQLDAIKYFDKRMGRDPDKKEQLDSEVVIQIVIDALTKHLSKEHPDLLRSIAAEIEVRMNLDAGSYNSPQP